MAQVEEIHQAFCREDGNFEIVWPAKFLDHEYYATDVAVQERQLVWKMKLHLSRLKEDVQVISDLRSAPANPAPGRAGKLPEIELPKFSGSYAEWPTFSELFTSLIIKDAQLLEIDRLHYLRSSLSGEPARRVNAFPLRGSSFQACWDMLTKRFANKRLPHPGAVGQAAHPASHHNTFSNIVEGLGCDGGSSERDLGLTECSRGDAQLHTGAYAHQFLG